MKVTYLERAPGTWRLRIELGKGPDGRRQFKYEVVHGSRDNAERRRFMILHEHEEGTFAVPDKVTLGAFFKQWIVTRLAMKKITRSTAENYTQMFNEYVADKLGGSRVQKITGADIQAVYTAMATQPTAKRKVLSDNTVRHMHRIMSSLFKAARRAKLVKSNPIEEVEAPNRAKQKPKALTAAGAVELLASLAGDWREPITLLALAAGLRRGEVLGLRWKDVELDAGKLHVRGQLVQYNDGTIEWHVPKTERGLRTISLAAEVVDMLRRLRIEAGTRRMSAGLGGGLDDAYVFTADGVAPIKPKALTSAFSAHCDAHGFAEFTFHGTRHTHLTELLRRVGKTGAKAVSERAGHADVTTTLSIYQTVFESDDRELAELSNGLLRVQNVPGGPKIVN